MGIQWQRGLFIIMNDIWGVIYKDKNQIDQNIIYLILAHVVLQYSITFLKFYQLQQNFHSKPIKSNNNPINSTIKKYLKQPQMKSGKNPANQPQQQKPYHRPQYHPTLTPQLINMISSPTQSPFAHSRKNSQDFQKIFGTGKGNENGGQDGDGNADRGQNDGSKRKSQKPYQKFTLPIQPLESPELMAIRSYRRLYNIVLNDQTSPNQIFRPNLIKQLYFLLRIVPVMETKLREPFLEKVQEWYNGNDHKKIKLSGNLDQIAKAMKQKKNRQKQQEQEANQFQRGKWTSSSKPKRPKTGLQWDRSLSPFLRPYTAKLKSSGSSQYQNQNKLLHNNASRPESSKFGTSTNAYTNCQAQPQFRQSFPQEATQFIEGGYPNQQNQITQFEEICDIEEEWQRSLDFKKKFRTLHPQQQPTYQKLMKLIDSLKPKPHIDKHIDQNQKSNFNISQSKKRKIQSAMLSRQSKQASNARALAQFQLKPSPNPVEPSPQPQLQQEQSFQQNPQPDSPSSSPQPITVNQAHPKFSKQSHPSTPHLYQHLNGTRILRPFTANQGHIINKLGQYSALEQNKYVIQTRIDEECAKGYREFVRARNFGKRDISRRVEARRYMDGFYQHVKVIKTKNSAMDTNGEQEVINVQNLLKQQKSQSKLQKQQQTQFQSKLTKVSSVKSQPVIIDLSQQPSIKNINKITAQKDKYDTKKSTYNIKKIFQPIKKQKIATASRAIGKVKSNFQDTSRSNNFNTTNMNNLTNTNTLGPFFNSINYKNTSSIQTSSNKAPLSAQPINKMTHQIRLCSQQIFDPLHPNHLQKYNQQIIQEMQKIKQKFGGKINIQTQKLVKALYVDAPIKIKNTRNQNEQYLKLFKNNESNPSNKQNLHVNGDTNSSRLVLPDKKYLMIQKEDKKKKKRKLKKIKIDSKKSKSNQKIKSKSLGRR